MNKDSVKILKWDFVLGQQSEKIPQITFKPSPEIISVSKLNNNNLFVNVLDSGSEKFDGRNFSAVVDKSTDIVGPNGNVIGCNIAQGCTNDFAADTILYTLTFPHTIYDDKLKGGSFSLMSEYIKKEEKKKDSIKEEKKPITSSDKIYGLKTLPLALIGGIIATATILTIILIRR